MTSNVALRCDDNEGGINSAFETAPPCTGNHLPVTKTSKPSILRNPIQRLRRRRQSDKQSSKKTGIGEEKASPVLPLKQQQEAVIEEVKVEAAEVRLFRRGRERCDAADVPSLEIVAESQQENEFYDSRKPPSPPQHNVGHGDDQGLIFTPTQNESITNIESDLPSPQALPHKYKPAGRGIMKDSKRSNIVRSSRVQRNGRKNVTFDESTIVQKHEKQKSLLDNISLAMPVILPYLIAVLILILSSLVPPDPASSGRIVNSKKQYRPISPQATLISSQSSSPMITTALSPTARAALKSDSPGLTTTKSGNSPFDCVTTSTETLAHDEGRQDQIEGQSQAPADSQRQETQTSPGQDCIKRNARSKATTTKNLFLRVWRALRRIGKPTTS